MTPTLVEQLAALEERLRQRRVRDLVDPARLAPLLDVLLGPAWAAELVVPALQALRPFTTAVLRADARPLQAYVPEEARRALLALADRPPRLPPALAQALVENPALEEVARDLLYDALREFNDRVNPFFAEWGLPAMIRKVLPIGGATVVRTLEAVRAEFDRRLEPEMRRFLHAFVRRGLRHLGEALAQGKDSPQLRALRRSLLEAVLKQPVAALAAAVDEEALALLDQAAAAVLLQLLPSERAAALRLEALNALVGAAGDLTLDELLERHQIRYRLPAPALAALLRHFDEG